MQQDFDIAAHPRLQDHDQAGDEIPGTNPCQPSREDILAGQEPQPDETPLQAQYRHNTPEDGAIHRDRSSREPRKNPMVEDFDDSANALWTLYGKEAKGYDEATIKSIKGDMDGVLIFAGLFSAVLTAFIIDRTQDIQRTPSPAQQSAFFQEQSVVLLNQISQQLSSLGAQVPIASNLSLSGPTVNTSASDVRVNICYFTSLVFSLSAALLATLVQRWARDHMYIFQRYSHPLKIARIRQYLHEGAKNWHMRATAEAVPGLVHISLFLFLVGLADFLWNTYEIVGKFTVIPISLCAALYVFSTIAPVINPKSPYRTAFSGLVWYLTRRVHKRWCNNRFGVDPKPLSSNMADGQMQLAMEKNDGRKGRDERAIRWLVDNLTEDIEVESLASGIPGSFDAKWGVEVWKNDSSTRSVTGSLARPEAVLRVPHPPPLPHRRSRFSSFLFNINMFFSGRHQGDSQAPINLIDSPPSHHDPHANPIPRPSSLLPVRGEFVDELCQRIQRLSETCNHRGSFVNEDEWRKRSRACIETAASFVLCMNADILSFGELGKLLSDLGTAEKTREASAISMNWSFIARWTCLSLVAVRKMLNSPEVQECADGTILTLGTFRHVNNFTPFETVALRNAQRIDEQLAAAWGVVERLLQAFNVLGDGDRRGERVEEILRIYESDLRRIQREADSMKRVDKCIFDLQNQIDKVTHNLTRQLPGITFDNLRGTTPIGQVFEFLADPDRPQLIYMSQRILGLCTLRHKRSSQGYQETAKVVKTIEKNLPFLRSVAKEHHLMERQQWRIQDLSIGGAFGFTLELYFLSLKQILSTFPSPPREVHITCYISAFKAITSDWDDFKDSLATQQIILNIVCDMAVEDRGIFSNFTYPDYITKELLELLGNMIEGQMNPYIDAAKEELRDVENWRRGNELLRKGAYNIILSHCGPPSGSS